MLIQYLKAPFLEGLALNRLVHDLPGQIERGEIEGQRGDDDRTDKELIAPRMLPDIPEQTFIHLVPGYHSPGLA
jgi:hypothetical protein